MPYGNDNNQPNTKDSPEEKRQKIIDEEVKEKEQLIEKTQDILVLREIAKSEIRSNVRRRLLLEEEKAEYKSKLEASERDKECYEKVLRIISVRSKLENFVDKNYPLRINSKTSETVYGKPDSSYCDALNEMLVSQNVRFTQDVFIVMIRNRLDNRNITPAVFMKFARWLYNQMSDKTCHKMAQFSPPLPKFDDDRAIKEMLKAVEIDEDDPAVICIQIILQPLDLPPIVTGTTP